MTTKHQQTQSAFRSIMSRARPKRRLRLVLTAFCILPFLYVIFMGTQVLPRFFTIKHINTNIMTCNTATINQSNYKLRPMRIDILSTTMALNRLSFNSQPPLTHLKIAVFIKKLPSPSRAGGMERHALTLHLALANRGHEIHVFTTNSSAPSPHPNVYVHATTPTEADFLNQTLAIELLQFHNSSGRPFDVVHSESVGLFHSGAQNISAVVASWHGIAYETIHSYIVEDLLRGPNEQRRATNEEYIAKVADEVQFFDEYAHHVAISDYNGDVLRRIYMIPEGRVHVILNGVDQENFRPDVLKGRAFLREMGVNANANAMIMGIAGRLVRDKGHPIMFEALKQLREEEQHFRQEVVVLVAGDGPWADRYRTLGSNVVVLGSLRPTQLAGFYCSLDVFVNPTLRAQGLDLTFLEAMMSGVPVMGTAFASVTGSVVVGPEVGYTFSPTVELLKGALSSVWREGKGELKRKGEFARKRALRLFTATKMALAYERLFLCLAQTGYDYCKYPLPGDL